jgi:hypothetical protein
METISPVTTVLPDRRFWGFSGVEYDKVLSTLYSIGLHNLDEDDFFSIPGIDPRSDSLSFGPARPAQALYKFTTPPQSYELVEPAATQIVPTQGGGKFIESHGSIFKDIRIAGTIGFRPNPVAPPTLNNKLGDVGTAVPTISIPGADLITDERGLPPEEVTGFDEIIFLRNIFRAYADYKQEDEFARKMVMIWMYAKEGEAWVVEPVSFTTTRDRSSPLSWAYQIQLKTLYRLDRTFNFASDPLTFFQKLDNAYATLFKLARDLSRSLQQVATLIDFFAGIPANILQDMVNAAGSVLGAAQAIRNSGESFKSIYGENGSFFKSAAANAATAKQLFDDNTSDRVLVGGQPTDIDVSPHEGKRGQARHVCTVMQRAFEAILALDKLWEERTRQVDVSNIRKAYLSEVGEAPFTAGSPLAAGNIRIPSAGREVSIDAGEDIRSIAKRYLKDEAQWKKIAILNNLKPPYISTEAADGVLTVGDKIIIPYEARGDEDDLSVPRALNTDSSMVDQSPIVRRYGRDIRLRPSVVSSDLSDLQVSDRGDLELIEGTDNVGQALMIKFSTEQGELATHPLFGTKYPLGTKINMVSMQQFSINTRKTLLSDQRVDRVANLRLFSQGDKIIVSARVALRDSDAQLPITFAVRN